MELKAAPSKEAIVKFLRKEPNAFQEVIRTFVERAVLIGAGIAILGDRENLVRNSFAASLSIELYLLWYYSQQLEKS